jgi:hypothetical protein
VNKHLKDAQQATFLQCTQYDHAFAEFRNEPEKRFEVVCDAVWRHVLGGGQDVNDNLIRSIGAYVEYQLLNIVYKLPDEYFDEGRIAWGNIPDFSWGEEEKLRSDDKKHQDRTSLSSSVTEHDHDDDALVSGRVDSNADSGNQRILQQQQREQGLKTKNAHSGLEFLQNHWVQVLTDAGEPYFWNMETNQTSWQKPPSS